MDTPLTDPPKLPPPWVRHLSWKAHRLAYRLVGARALWAPGGSRRGGVMHLTTTGRRSGRPRGVIIGYLVDGGTPFAVAMNGGEDAPPSWWLNLQARPEALIRLPGESERRVRARRSDGDERDRLWRQWTELGSGIDAIAELRTTETPVVVFEPVA